MSQISRFYINHMKKERECSNCHIVKPFSEFGEVRSDVKNNTSVRSNCNPCRTIIEGDKRRLRTYRKNPKKYYKCDNDFCCYIWLKTFGEYCSRCGQLNGENQDE